MGLFDKLFGKKDKEEIKEQVNKEKEDIGKEANEVELEEEKEKFFYRKIFNFLFLNFNTYCCFNDICFYFNV